MSKTVVVTNEHGDEQDFKDVERFQIDPNTSALYLNGKDGEPVAMYAPGEWSTVAFLEEQEDHPLSREAVEGHVKRSVPGYEYEDACRYFDLGREWERSEPQKPSGVDAWHNAMQEAMALRKELPQDNQAVMAYVDLIRKYLAMIDALTLKH